MQTVEVLNRLAADPSISFDARHPHALSKLESPNGPLAHAAACGYTTTGIRVHDHDIRTKEFDIHNNGHRKSPNGKYVWQEGYPAPEIYDENVHGPIDPQQWLEEGDVVLELPQSVHTHDSNASDGSLGPWEYKDDKITEPTS